MDKHGDTIIEQGRHDGEGDIENPGGGIVRWVIHPIELPVLRKICEVELGSVGSSVSINEHSGGPASNKVDPIDQRIVLE